MIISSEIKFDQVWSILIHFDPFSTDRIQSDQKINRIENLMIYFNDYFIRNQILSSLIHFDPFWSILIHFDPFWSTSIHFDPSILEIESSCTNRFPWSWWSLELLIGIMIWYLFLPWFCPKLLPHAIHVQLNLADFYIHSPNPQETSFKDLTDVL